MFSIEAYINLGVLGQSIDATCWGVVEHDEHGYAAKILKVGVDHPLLRDKNVLAYLNESQLSFLERRLINRYIAAQARNELTPEDWAADHG